MKSFFLYPYAEKTFYMLLGGVLFVYIHPNEIPVELLQLRFNPEEKEKIFEKLVFPMKNQNYLNVPAVPYFLEKGEPSGIVQDSLKNFGLIK